VTGINVNVADADLVGSTWLVAVIVTVCAVLKYGAV
jgi:hypothetical protein